jgi:hypothetical protein
MAQVIELNNKNIKGFLLNSKIAYADFTDDDYLQIETTISPEVIDANFNELDGRLKRVEEDLNINDLRRRISFLEQRIAALENKDVKMR